MADKEEGEVNKSDGNKWEEENISRGNELEEENKSCGNDLEEGNTSHGNGWEVVSLTASAYAAAPGPREVESKDDKERDTYGEDEISRALFMSGHFVFPRREHENLPMEFLKPDKSEIQNENVGKDAASEFGVQEGSRSSGKDGEDWNLKGLNVPDEYTGMQLYDEKGNKLPIHSTEFEEDATLQGLNLTDEEQSLYSAYDSEAELGKSTIYGENTATAEITETSEQGVGSPADMPHSPQTGQDDKHSGSVLPCEAWWKRRMLSLYAHAKEANHYWSIFVAAAVMGLVLLGQQWQQERWQALHLKWQQSIRNEHGRMLGPISRLKDVIVGGHRRGSFVRGSASSDC
ncbi:hypothetical protein SLEP1_g9954 [Rubroshorea leprosula]|uniref:ATG8-interacting protein 1 n=1 Tax=Rubroshorea leprosula TaxID=152421 RepID=A0AAV5IGG5_9ROSI|nr:hypothetical protein SLEP1_g9954 [Rubroshorea leprosula]